MKRTLTLLNCALLLAILLGANVRGTVEAEPQPAITHQAPCQGYTIIEYGKGINCHGDTVKLVKVGGIQTLVVESLAN